jgi:TnpA family transposase
VEKTLYLLAYVQDENYRRRILVQLNRGEGRHALARAVFHGKKGELRQRYREGIEDQLGALGLVVNALALWNTRYLQQALEQWQETDKHLNPEDVARLSPLLHEHVNMLEAVMDLWRTLGYASRSPLSE